MKAVRHLLFFWQEEKKSEEKPLKEAIVVLHSFNDRLNVWQGEFFDTALCWGYVCGLSADEAKNGDRVKVRVENFDKNIGCWKLTAIEKTS